MEKDNLAKMVLVGLFSFLSINYAANPKHRLIVEGVTDRKSGRQSYRLY